MKKINKYGTEYLQIKTFDQLVIAQFFVIIYTLYLMWEVNIF